MISPWSPGDIATETAPRVGQMIDLLFDYTYNLGEAELASDQDIEVKTRFETTEALR